MTTSHSTLQIFFLYSALIFDSLLLGV